jgi:heptose I phosphotransferase
MGRTGALNYGSLWERWVRGVSWTWINEPYRGWLPDDLDRTVMSLSTPDRLHRKQGRTTARVVFPGAAATGEPRPGPDRPLAIYLKRHEHLPWVSRWAALFHPGGRYSPGAAEWAHLERARGLGIEVPDAVAAGERIGPRARFRSFLMVAELAGCAALHEVLPKLAGHWEVRAFAAWKRRLIAELARIVATLHAAHLFHKDLYLCHFFLDLDRLGRAGQPPRVVLIDFHRLGHHRLCPAWWRWKDLGQLLFSTYGVTGIDDRDRWRFWRCYRRHGAVRLARRQARLVRFRAARYARHNRTPR